VPFVKVPGIDREIWFDLHDPEGPETPWFVDAGTEVMLTPEQIAAEMADPGSEWRFLPPLLGGVPKKAQPELDANARKFQKARTVRGRPFAHNFSRAEDFAVTAIVFEAMGFRQSTKRARLYWQLHGQHCPSPTQIEQALKLVRGWLLIDLKRAFQSIRKSYRLTRPIPQNKKRPI